LSQETTAPVGSTPRHVAIIMDGNGRWAQSRGLPRNEGHREGVRNVEKIVRAAKDHDIRYLTLYAFSVENWNRPRAEISALMTLLEQFLKAQARTLKEQQIRLRVIGRIEELPAKVRRLLEKTMAETAHFSDWTLTLALNYGSRTEIVDAARAFAREVAAGRANPEQLDWPTLAAHLHTGDLPDPDLIIRTSGEHRVSNFLLLQSAYAEYYFSPKFWPEFGPEEFAAALQDYARRERRFGKTGEQVRAATPVSPA